MYDNQFHLYKFMQSISCEWLDSPKTKWEIDNHFASDHTTTQKQNDEKFLPVDLRKTEKNWTKKEKEKKRNTNETNGEDY